ncbi:hypothetical protein CPB86DRAFT_813774 [Serendipita vermifera]|nr:hypothetical protein CPB86DRAFT_813774 [Serendipita vermifera]
MSSLLALHVGWFEKFDWDRHLNGAILPRITHLSIDFEDHENFNILPCNMNLDHLQYLSLDFLDEMLTNEKWKRGLLLGWSFPSLKSLAVSGYVPLAIEEDMRSLFRSCGSSVTELFLNFDWRDSTNVYGQIPEADVWKYFPKLRVYRIDINHLLNFSSNSHLQRSDYDGPSQSLTLVTLIRYFDGEKLKKYQRNLIELLSLWKVVKIVLMESWCELLDCWLNREWSERAQVEQLHVGKLLVDMVTQANVPLCDAMGSTIDSERGRPLWSAMCRAYDVIPAMSPTK